jgi:hypothetical protein
MKLKKAKDRRTFIFCKCEFIIERAKSIGQILNLPIEIKNPTDPVTGSIEGFSCL